MSKSSTIKWRDSDEKLLKQVVKNYNAKISRIIKNKPELAKYQPEKIKYSDVKASINNRKDFNREINSIKRYSRKGVEEVKTNEKGLTLTKYEIKEATIKTQAVNRMRSKKVKDLGLDIKKGTGSMKQLRELNLQPKVANLGKKESRKEFEMYMSTLEKELQGIQNYDKMKMYQLNYIDGFASTFGSSTETIELIKQLYDMDAEKFYQLSVSNPLTKIGVFYDASTLDERREAVNTGWAINFNKMK